MALSQAASTELEHRPTATPQPQADTNGDIDINSSLSFHPPSSSPDASADTISSLRAAALSSMRSKRRKVGDKPKPVLVRHIPTTRPDSGPNAVLLDYGNEDAAAGDHQRSDGSSISTTEPNEPRTSTKRRRAASSDDLENELEEGEISDDAEEPIPAATASGHQVNGQNSPIIKQERLPTPPMAASTPVDDGLRGMPSRGTQSMQSDATAPMRRPTSSSLASSKPMIDANHVRPGLTSEHALSRFKATTSSSLQ